MALALSALWQPSISAPASIQVNRRCPQSNGAT